MSPDAPTTDVREPRRHRPQTDSNSTPRSRSWSLTTSAIPSRSPLPSPELRHLPVNPGAQPRRSPPPAPRRRLEPVFPCIDPIRQLGPRLASFLALGKSECAAPVVLSTVLLHTRGGVFHAPGLPFLMIAGNRDQSIPNLYDCTSAAEHL